MFLLNFPSNGENDFWFSHRNIPIICLLLFSHYQTAHKEKRRKFMQHVLISASFFFRLPLQMTSIRIRFSSENQVENKIKNFPFFLVRVWKILALLVSDLFFLEESSVISFHISINFPQKILIIWTFFF